MYRIKGKIQGTAPILFCRFADPLELEKGGKGKQSQADRLAEVETRVYRNDNGLYLPAWNFKRCLVDGCKKAGLKEGKGSEAPYMLASVFVEGELLFGKETYDFVHSVVGRIPPRTGAAAIIRRPALKEGWELPFNLLVVDDRRQPEHVRRSLEEAGMLCGLGGWRPEYGRFIVTEWEVRAEQSTA